MKNMISLAAVSAGLMLVGTQATLAQSPPGCGANYMNINIHVASFDVPNGTKVDYEVIVTNGIVNGIVVQVGVTSRTRLSHSAALAQMAFPFRDRLAAPTCR
jgi:hypothetical protein